MKIHKKDLVLIIKGKDRGKTGSVLKVQSATKTVTVENVNKVKKHVKGRGNVKSGIIQFEAPLKASNVMLICPNCQKKTRVAYKVNKESKKIRICNKCHESVEQVRETKQVRK